MPKYEVRMQYKVRHVFEVDAPTELEAVKEFDKQFTSIDWKSDAMNTFYWNSRMEVNPVEEKK